MLNSRFAFLTALLLGGSAVTSAQTEKDLIAVLQKPDAPLKDKADACFRLKRSGTKAAVPVLATLLADEKLAHMARYALESVPDPSVDSAFRVALTKLSGRQLAGVISSVGARRDTGAVEPLILLLRNSDPGVVQAAARALGTIGSSTAAKALEDAWTNAVPENRLAVAEGLLRSAEVLFTANQRDPALALFSKLRLPDVPHQVRTAAIRGAILANKNPASALLYELLRANDLSTVSAVVRAGMDLPPHWSVTDALTQAAGQALGDRKIVILQAIGNTGDPDTLPALLQAAQTPDKGVQVAAVRAMGRVNNPGAVPVLTGFLTDAEVGAAARDSLAAIQGAEADATVFKLFQSNDKAQRRLGMDLVTRRRMTAQLPGLLQALSDGDPEIRLAALQAVGEIGGAAQLPPLLDLLCAADGAAVAVAERAVNELVAKISSADATAAVEARLAKAQAAQKLPLLRVLGAIGGPKALAAARAALRDPDPKVRETAIRILGEWKTVDAAPVLLECAKSATVPAERMLSLNRYFKVAAQGGDKDPQQRIALCREAAKVVQSPEEKKLLLKAFGSIPSAQGVTALLPYVEDGATRAEAVAAALDAADRLIRNRRTPPEVARQLVGPLQKIANVADGPAAERAKALLRQAELTPQP